MTRCRAHHRGPVSIAWDGVAISDAQHPADALADRAALRPSVLDGVPLAAGEFAYGELYVTGWRFFGLDTVFYERRAVLAGGGLLMLASAIGNRRRRREAEACAAPQWRPLGPLRVVVTSQRILVWHRNAWWSVWFAGVLAVHCFHDHQTLDLLFEADVPYRLAGPGVPALGVIVSETLRRNRRHGLLGGGCAGSRRPPGPDERSGHRSRIDRKGQHPAARDDRQSHPPGPQREKTLVPGSSVCQWAARPGTCSLKYCRNEAAIRKSPAGPCLSPPNPYHRSSGAGTVEWPVRHRARPEVPQGSSGSSRYKSPPRPRCWDGDAWRTGDVTQS